MVQPGSAASGLHDDLVAGLRNLLLPGEQVIVTVRGKGPSGFAATTARLLMGVGGTWHSYAYADVTSVEVRTGWKKWLALRGPGFPPHEPGFSDLGTVRWAIAARDDQELRAAAVVSQRLLVTLAGMPLPSTVALAFTGQQRDSDMPGQGAELLAEAEGSGGHIWVWVDRLRIKHFGVRGLLTKGVLKGDKDIWLDQISGIQWREPGAMWLGHIQFTLIGGSTNSALATRDENAVLFTKQRRDEFERVKLAVEARIRELRLGRGTAGDTSTAAHAGPDLDVYDAVRKLGELRDAGLLTTAEFETKKADLLSRL